MDALTERNTEFTDQIKTATAALLRKRTKLRISIAAAGPCSLVPSKALTPFHALARSIVYQQLHGKAAATIWKRTTALFGSPSKMTPAKLLEVSDLQLRSAGLSKNKQRALRDLAEKGVRREIPSWRALEKMSNEEIVEVLTQVRGIGEWTVQMMLLFSLGRLDVWPTADYGVRNGYAILHGMSELPSEKEMKALGDVWRPYRSIAAWYLWRVVDLERSGILTGKKTK